jgi:L,D-peptidoglycan transpeptidase YkuD (ErfK/YbiS/YcfS/YnhG family)
VPFSNVAAEQDPFTENLIDPLSSGMLNLSWGVKVAPVCACVLGQAGKSIKTMMRTVASPVKTILLMVTFKVSLYEYNTVFSFGYKAFQPPSLWVQNPACSTFNSY